MLKNSPKPSPAAELGILTYRSGLLVSEQPEVGAKLLEIHFFSFLVRKIPCGSQCELLFLLYQLLAVPLGMARQGSFVHIRILKTILA